MPDIFDLELDGALEIEGQTQRLALALSNVKPEIDAATKYLAGQVEDRAENSTGLFKALSAGTLAARAAKVRRGEELVASLDTPLRAFHDSVRLAAIALREGVAGSAFQDSSDAETFGINPDDEKTPWMRRVLLGDPDNNTPARDLMDLPESDLQHAGQIVEEGVARQFHNAQ